MIKGLPVAIPLLEDRLPAQPGLGPFQDQELEEAAVVVERHAPLRIVVRDGEFRPGPFAPSLHPLVPLAAAPHPRVHCISRPPAMPLTNSFGAVRVEPGHPGRAPESGSRIGDAHPG